jgi:hypothetical protein
MISALLLAGSTSTVLGAARQGCCNADLSPAEIIRRSVAVNEADWRAQPQFEYKEQDVKSKVDSSGQAHVEQVKAWEVMMIDGSPYSKLIGQNGEPLPAAQEAKENDKMRAEITKRQSESQSSRQSRISKYKNDRAEEHLLMQQMAEAFTFKIVAEETVNGYPCYVLDANPDPNYKPPVQKARVLTGMHGRMWIDKEHFHWVKVQAEVTSPVEFGFFIAKVKPGTSFELEQEPVGNVWLPKKFVEDVNASVLGLYGLHTKEVDQYSEYQPENRTGTQVAADLHAKRN